MNWKQIQENYPKAWGKLKEAFSGWANLETKTNNRLREDSIFLEMLKDYPRYLYDFFDNQGMWVNIDCNYSCDPKGLRGDQILFNWKINLRNSGDTYYDKSDNMYAYKLRKDCEASVFAKAFELLERQLCNESLNKRLWNEIS